MGEHREVNNMVLEGRTGDFKCWTWGGKMKEG